MKRRQFLKSSAVSAAVYPLISCKSTSLLNLKSSTEKTHIISLSFDDGFRKSFLRVAEIHENYGTHACLNVIASGHLPSFQAIDPWILPELMGDFNDWNILISKGHEVMPHTWEHKDLTKVSLPEAKERLDKCFDYFNENLDGYSHDTAVYNYAFNASTEELDLYALTKVKAIRTGYWVALKDDKITNEFPKANYSEPIRLGCWFHGPDNGDMAIDKGVNEFLSSDGGWLIINMHGLDDEGWGPVSTSYYDGLIKRLIKIDNLDLLPVGEVLKKYEV